MKDDIAALREWDQLAGRCDYLNESQRTALLRILSACEKMEAALDWIVTDLKCGLGPADVVRQKAFAILQEVRGDE